MFRMTTAMTTGNPMTASRWKRKGQTWWQYAATLLALSSVGCAPSAPSSSPFDLDLSLSEGSVEPQKTADTAEHTAKPDEGNGEADGDAAASAAATEAPEIKAPCAFEATRRIEVKNPVRVSSYALDTLGILEATTPDDACLASLIRDGAQILAHAEGRITAFYPNRFDAFLADYASQIDVDAIEGRYDFENGRLIAGIDGRRVDREKTREALFSAVLDRSPQFEIVIETSHALSHDIHAFSGFKPEYRIGHFTTRFSKAKNRTVNVKLAAAAMNGLFLMPGAEFSYNDWVGERSEARGFKEAPVIEQGQLVEGLGGGACQVSSTIHAAALLAGLGIEERYNHSLPSSYIPVGMDAVVSYPNLDLRVRNPLSVPVVLKVTTKDDLLTAEFFSNEPQKMRVLFRKEIVEELPYRETITVDPTLEEGTIKVRKRGKPGYKVQRGRIFWNDGKETFEKLNMDTYQSQPQQTSIAVGVVYPNPE